LLFRGNLKIPLFLPYLDFPHQLQLEEERKRKQKEELSQKINHLKEECKWIEDALIKRIEVILSFPSSFALTLSIS
jgi:hypothetical protein